MVFFGGAGILFGLFPTRLRFSIILPGIVACCFGVHWLYLAKKSSGSWWPPSVGRSARTTARRTSLMAIGWLAVSGVSAAAVHWILPRDPLRLFLFCSFFVSAVAVWTVALIGIRRLSPRSDGPVALAPAFLDQYSEFVSTLGTFSMFAGGSAILLGVLAARENILVAICGFYACAFGVYWLHLAKNSARGRQTAETEATFGRAP